MKEKITKRRPIEGHGHFRELLHFQLRDTAQGKCDAFAVFRALVQLLATTYSGGVAMPNLKNGWVSTPEQLSAYVATLRSLIDECGRTQFRLLPTFRITHETTPKMIEQFRNAGAFAGKVFPDTPGSDAVTTNSSGGICRFFDSQLIDTMRAMAAVKMPCLCHCEMPDSSPDTAEQDFIPVVGKWLELVPDLRFGFEHISSRAGVAFVRSAGNNVIATITPQHATQLKRDWCEEHGGNPHNQCKPSMKSVDDREAIIDAVVSGHPRFCYGGDPAAHLEVFKRRGPECKVAYGCFNPHAAVPTFIELLKRRGALERFDDFMSGNFCRFHGIEPPTEMATYVREPLVVPADFHGIVPWRAGETLQWQELVDK